MWGIHSFQSAQVRCSASSRFRFQRRLDIEVSRVDHVILTLRITILHVIISHYFQLRNGEVFFQSRVFCLYHVLRRVGKYFLTIDTQFEMNPGWHRYFDNNDVNNWNVRDFHETWIRENKSDPKKLSYQKASDAMRKSLRCLVNDCKRCKRPRNF